MAATTAETSLPFTGWSCEYESLQTVVSVLESRSSKSRATRTDKPFPSISRKSYRRPRRTSSIISVADGHFNETGIHRENLLVLVGYNNSLTEHFEDGLHAGESFRLVHR